MLRILCFERVSLEGRTETPQVTLDEQQQTATFAFRAPLAPGHYVLAIDYRGKIYQQASGFFVLDYDGHGSAKQHALFTQFENSDARRFLPCWDEPGSQGDLHAKRDRQISRIRSVQHADCQHRKRRARD